MLFFVNTMCTSRIFAQNNHLKRMRDTNETKVEATIQLDVYFAGSDKPAVIKVKAAVG